MSYSMRQKYQTSDVLGSPKGIVFTQYLNSQEVSITPGLKDIYHTFLQMGRWLDGWIDNVW